MSLTIGYITARENPELNWLIDSLQPQLMDDDRIQLLVVNGTFLGKSQMIPRSLQIGVTYIEPKPSSFSGQFRVTNDNWWTKSNSINTLLCYADNDYVVMVDDRSYLGGRWMEAVRDARNGNYILCGAYEKHIDMDIQGGVVKSYGPLIGADHRSGGDGPVPCGGEWMFGVCTGAPLEWWLNINGSPERCDGMSFEDVITGIIFQNNGYPIKYDRRAMVFEDRTPSQIGKAIRRESKERHPHDTADKAHTTLRWARSGVKQSDNKFDLRKLREEIRTGGFFPMNDVDQVDWFDSQPLKEFK
jgi:hypothetical protein